MELGNPWSVDKTNPGISKRTGVYVIQNTVNQKRYIGSAANSFSVRWGRHRSDLRLNRNGNKHLQASWNKHGEKSFVFKILEDCPKEQCVAREQVWIDKFKPEYNMLPSAGSCLGYKQPEEVKNRASMSMKGRVFTDEHKAKLKEAWKHRVLSQKEIDRITATGKGNVGRKHSPESCAKKSLAAMGNKYNLGRHPSEETKRKIAEAGTGRRHSVETRMMMSLARKIYWARRRLAIRDLTNSDSVV